MSERTFWGPYEPFKHFENVTACTCTIQYESGKGTFRLTDMHCPVHGVRASVSGTGADTE